MIYRTISSGCSRTKTLMMSAGHTLQKLELAMVVSLTLFLMTGCSGSSDPKPLPSPSPLPTTEISEDQNPTPDSAAETPENTGSTSETTTTTTTTEADATASTDPQPEPPKYSPSDFGSPTGDNTKNTQNDTSKPTDKNAFSASSVLDPAKLFNMSKSPEDKDIGAILKGKPRTRPEDVTKWELSDFIPARDDNDPKLKIAIEYHEKKYRGKPLFAKLLTKLITLKTEATTPDSPDDMGMMSMHGPGGGSAQQIDQQLVEMMVLRLAANNTSEASTTLREIVKNKKYKVLHPQTATKVALKGLAIMDVDGPANDKVLFEALTQPTKYRKKSSTNTPGGMPYGRGMSYGGGMSGDDQRMTAEQLAQEAEQCLKTLASENLRELLAGYLLKSTTSAAERQKFRSWFTESSPTNVLSQLRLYEASPPDPELLSQLEEHFTKYSRFALGRLLGIEKSTPPDLSFISDPNAMGRIATPTQPSTGWGSGGGGFNTEGMGGGYGGGYGNSDFITEYLKEKPKTHPDKKLAELIQKLWEPSLTTVVGNRLNQTPNQNIMSGGGLGGMRSGSTNENQVISLACTIPLDTVRHAILKRCKSHYQQGPNTALGNALGQSGGSGNSMDPAITAGSGTMGGMGSGANSQIQAIDPGLLVTLKMLPREDPNATNGTQGSNSGVGMGGAGNMQHQWFTTSQQLVTDILKQCYLVASPANGTMEDDPCPLPPHKGAEVVSRLDLKLPGGIMGALSSLPIDPIEIHYVRIEEIGNLQRVLGHYKRAVKGQNHMLSSNMGYWFDGIPEGATPGSRRSVDVIVSPGVEKPVDPFGDDRNARKKKGVPIVVQILTIETADPMVPK